MPRSTNEEREKRRGEWQAHVEAARHQGLSLRAYAEQNGLNVHQLYRWRRKLAGSGRGAVVSFAPVHVVGGGAQRRLHLPNGVVLEWEGGADLALIERLLRLTQPRR
jgi:transposase-like protein